jgi:hypothetical protein
VAPLSGFDCYFDTIGTLGGLSPHFSIIVAF